MISEVFGSFELENMFSKLDFCGADERLQY